MALDESTSPSSRDKPKSHQPRSEVRDGMHIDWDVPIKMDDGLVLRADVFRPVKPGKYPDGFRASVIVSPIFTSPGQGQRSLSLE